jgi:hypothetical protein
MILNGARHPGVGAFRGNSIMAWRCLLTGKGPLFGH